MNSNLNTIIIFIIKSTKYKHIFINEKNWHKNFHYVNKLESFVLSEILNTYSQWNRVLYIWYVQSEPYLNLITIVFHNYCNQSAAIFELKKNVLILARSAQCLMTKFKQFLYYNVHLFTMCSDYIKTNLILHPSATKLYYT